MVAGELASFGQWLKARRRSLDLTQKQLAQQVNCSVETVRKLEADSRRPSRQIAELLAEHLQIFPEATVSFVQFARAGFAPRDVALTHPASLINRRMHHNLPDPPTPLIGRDETIAGAVRSLSRSTTRLLTLLGPPGIGKTRLAIALAYALLDEFPDGVYFVPLAAISDPALVAPHIIQTLSIVETNNRPPEERLKAHLCERQTLLVLDNLEQILEAVPLIAELLSACPWLKIVVTSRTPLRLSREHQFPVPPLSLPDIQQLPSVEALLQYAAIELFIERAQAITPDFILTAHNALAVATICHQLDGLPLAIELISARVNLLPPAALLQRLHGGMILRSSGQTDFETRHRTLNAAIEWSYRLLSPDEQSLFRRLGVFMGGCTLEAIEAICSPPMDTLNGVALLMDNNLLRQEVDLNGEPRFVLFETIREYALERLQESGEEPALRQSHATYYVVLAERTEAGLQRDGYLQWLDSMEAERGNLRMTLDWCEKLDIEKGLRLIVASHHPVTLSTHSHALQGGERVECLLNADSTVSVTNPLLWARALNVAARLAYVRKDISALRRWAEKALYFSRQIEDEQNILYALRSMGQATALQGLYQLSETINIEGLALARETGDNWFICFFLNIMGLLNRNRGDYAKAFSYHVEAAKLVRHIEDKPFVHTILWELGTSSLFVENFEQGYECYLESIASSKERISAYDLEGFAGLAAFQKHPERAACLLGAAEALRETQDTPRMKFDQYYEQFVTMTRAQLDEPAFNDAWAEGRVMNLEQALAYALCDTN